jgi:hypothetical protein
LRSLHLLAVLVDKEVTLSHGVEIVTEEDGVGSLVRLEEAFDRSLELVGHLVQLEVEAKNVVLEELRNAGFSDRLSPVMRTCRRHAVNVQVKAKFAT